jgi:hypothetical protein
MSPIKIRPVDPTKMRPAPSCDACGIQMWWHGRSGGWGCPSGSPGCRSSLYRPKRDPNQYWAYRDRYPELCEEADKA